MHYGVINYVDETEEDNSNRMLQRYICINLIHGTNTCCHTIAR